jgi:hypothetical protein
MLLGTPTQSNFAPCTEAVRKKSSSQKLYFYIPFLSFILPVLFPPWPQEEHCKSRIANQELQIKNCKSRIANQELQIKNCKSRIANTRIASQEWQIYKKKSFRQFGQSRMANLQKKSFRQFGQIESILCLLLNGLYVL